MIALADANLERAARGAVDDGLFNADQVCIEVVGGARVRTGGRRGSGRATDEPTVLLDVDHRMRCLREEVFGPVNPIMAVRNVDEAVRWACR